MEKKRNLWVIPTEKPSRLMIDTIENKLYLQPILHEKTINVLPQHICITSDEEIKLNDYVIQVNFEKTNTQVIRCETESQVKIANDKNGSFTKNKIILTTDQDLISDGVQAIDDEFLEWFVKNPTCEKVEVEKWTDYNLENGKEISFIKYKIIIPQEEPKQETVEDESIVVKVDWSGTPKLVNPTLEELTEEIQDECHEYAKSISALPSDVDYQDAVNTFIFMKIAELTLKLKQYETRDN